MDQREAPLNLSRLPGRTPWAWGALCGILLCEALLAADVQGWWPGFLPRLVRANMTPLCWLLYLVFALGLLAKFDGVSWLRRFRNRFWVCWLWSVPAWCYFDWMNFYFMRDPATGLRAWEYHSLPDVFADRLVGYLIAFGAIAPGMFLSAEVLMRLGFKRLRTTGVPVGDLRPFVLLAGVGLVAVPFVVGGPVSNLALWVGTFCLLDPINAVCGRPSIMDDWRQGRWGRTLALGAGGLWCGFLWEFWNYWAITKWTYHLPFLGAWEKVKYFEMPVPGLAGFIAFGIQTWVMWQTSLLALAPFVEGEGASPADDDVKRYVCF